jgi:hypothetical protein
MLLPYCIWQTAGYIGTPLRSTEVKDQRLFDECRRSIAFRLAADYIENAIAFTDGLRDPAWADYPGIDDGLTAGDYTWMPAADNALRAQALLTSPEWREEFHQGISWLGTARIAIRVLNAHAAYEALRAALHSFRANSARAHQHPEN